MWRASASTGTVWTRNGASGWPNVGFTIPAGRVRCGHGGGHGLEGPPGLPDRLVEKRHTMVEVTVVEGGCHVAVLMSALMSQDVVDLPLVEWVIRNSDEVVYGRGRSRWTSVDLL